MISNNQHQIAIGDEVAQEKQDNYELKKALSETVAEEGYANTDCTILWWNGEYQRPNIEITKGKMYVVLGTNVTKVQMRHSQTGAIRYYYTGVAVIPNGLYVLSLFGSTYPYDKISACVSYD